MAEDIGYSTLDDGDQHDNSQSSQNGLGLVRSSANSGTSAAAAAASSRLKVFGSMLQTGTTNLIDKVSAAAKNAGAEISQRTHEISQRTRQRSSSSGFFGEADSSDTESLRSFQLIKVHVPIGVDPGYDFFVALPGGGTMSVETPDDMFGGSQEEIGVPFDAAAAFKMDRDNQLEFEHLRGVPKDEILLALYRRHNPSERDAIVMKGAHGLGVSVVDGPYGVQVYAAAHPGPENAIVADDIIVSVNGTQIADVQAFSEFAQQVPLGDAVVLGLLRKSLPLMQRCPIGHPMCVVAQHRPIRPDALCNRCHLSISDQLDSVYTCYDCDWNICHNCYCSVYENLNSGKTANDPPPDWIDHYEEAPYDTKLTFSKRDVGIRLRVFWQTTGEWWLGEILRWDPNDGHTIVYQEGDWSTGKRSQERIRDMSIREYVVLDPKDGYVPVTVSQLEQSSINSVPESTSMDQSQAQQTNIATQQQEEVNNESSQLSSENEQTTGTQPVADVQPLVDVTESIPVVNEGSSSDIASLLGGVEATDATAQGDSELSPAVQESIASVLTDEEQQLLKEIQSRYG